MSIPGLSATTNLRTEFVGDVNLSKHFNPVNYQEARPTCEIRAGITWEGAREGLRKMADQAHAKRACVEAT